MGRHFYPLTLGHQHTGPEQQRQGKEPGRRSDRELHGAREQTQGHQRCALQSGLGCGRDRGHARGSGATGSEAEEEDLVDIRGLILGLDRGFVDQHHRDVILDRVHAMTLLALQSGVVVHEDDRRLAVRAREDFE